MNLKTEKTNHIKIRKIDSTSVSTNSSSSVTSEALKLEIENICDENLITLQKIHAILLNCSNLSKNQKLEFCESERYFMKLYLKKLKENYEDR
ncbi:MAG: hypothetical protein KAT57_08600 [Candidatus Lokiarchaeota archaeon]|nr:hypothetical protein [Candidatus Lokiarchaeota archaeon]